MPSFINFKSDEFFYLNITSLGSDLVQDSSECGFSCLGITSCFSYNVATLPDINGKLLCELLPSDKYSNSDKFNASPFHHHFSIPVSTKLNLQLITAYTADKITAFEKIFRRANRRKIVRIKCYFPVYKSFN